MSIILNNSPEIKPIKKLESTPEIEKVRAAYKALRKNLKTKGVEVGNIGIIKRKGIYGIKIGLTDEKNANQVPVFQDTVPIHKIEIVKKIVKPPVLSEHTYNGKQFIIEKVKWEWAAAVKSKSVYRDDEFVRTKTKEEALESIDFLMSKHKGLTYTITVFRDGEYFTFHRHSMPCLGGLVKYKDSHGEKYSHNPYFPRDIRVAFPEGDITFIGIHSANILKSIDNPYYQFILSSESPWVNAFGNKETIIIKDNHYILTNMNAEPTVLYSLVRLGGFGAGIYGGGQNKNIHPKAFILQNKTNQGDPRRFCSQKPIIMPNHKWSDGHGYVRPHAEHIFHTSLPNKFAKFSKLPGYPQATQDRKYFLDAMRKQFGIDMSSVRSVDKKINDILVESWEYFKEKGKELSVEN